MGLFGSKPKYAVVDVETTGVYPNNDRVIEVAAIDLRPDGSIEQEWSTLLNPMRDLGPVSIHHIEARDVLDAPHFNDIAGDLAELLGGRVIVGHNVSFDAGFLESEYRRTGHPEVSLSQSLLCTLRLSRQILPPGPRTLEACCTQTGVVNTRAHSALGDAQATAELLRRLASKGGGLSGLGANATPARMPSLPRTGAKLAHRRNAGERDEPFLARISTRVPAVAGPDAYNDYLAILDRALIDRVLSARESNELIALAAALGIDRQTAERLNADYLRALALAALEDGEVSRSELNDLTEVAKLLGLGVGAVRPALDRAQQVSSATERITVSSFHLAPGDSVVFTGEGSHERPLLEQMATAAGVIPKSSVSRKTTVLVTDHPDSLSTKARAAAEHGIPIITEATFIRLLKDVHPRLVTPTDGMPKNPATVVLSRGSKLQVTGEEEHLDRLVRWLDRRAAWDVIVTLHADWPTRSTGAQRMGVRLFGEPVGRLSPATTAQLRDVIEACEQRGLIPACAAQVRGNQMKVDVTIDVAKGSAIPQAWLDDNVFKNKVLG